MLNRPGLEQLTTYDIEESDFAVRLDANEQPVNLPAAVRKEVLDRLATLAFNRYPEIGVVTLRQKIAAAMNIAVDGVLVGNGSSELLEAACYAFGGQGRSIVFPAPSFSMYAIYAKLADSQPVPIPLGEDFSLRVEDVLAAAHESRASLIILCNPNNPTGSVMSDESIEAIVSGVNCPVIVDEAYYEFYGHSALHLLAKYDNLIITRTFSKAYSMAAARVGYLMAAPKLAQIVAKTVLPYPVNALSLICAETVYERRKAFEPDIDQAIRERRRMADTLASIKGVTVYPSQTNFLLVACPQAGELAEHLAQSDIGIRDFSNSPRLQGCLRFTVGTADENNILLRAIKQFYEVKI